MTQEIGSTDAVLKDTIFEESVPKDSPTKPEPAPVAVKEYDAVAAQVCEATLTRGGRNYQTAFTFKPLEDERYFKMLDDRKISGNEDNLKEDVLGANSALFDDLCSEMLNVEDPKKILPAEKDSAIGDYLAVAIGEPDEAETSGMIPDAAENVVKTECFFNGFSEADVVSQTHYLKLDTSGEYKKKYLRIWNQRAKPEPTRGLRGKPKMIFRPQDRKLAALYDEMFIRAEGFKGGVIPARFKVAAIHEIFADPVSEKK